MENAREIKLEQYARILSIYRHLDVCFRLDESFRSRDLLLIARPRGSRFIPAESVPTSLVSGIGRRSVISDQAAIERRKSAGR